MRWWEVFISFLAVISVSTDHTLEITSRFNSTASPRIVSVGNFSATHPAFLFVEPLQGVDALLYTSFTGNPVKTGCVYLCSDIAKQISKISSRNDKIRCIDECEFAWPNSINFAPKGIFKGELSMIVADGFLVPGKSDGGLYFLEVVIKGGEPTFTKKKLVAPIKKKWFHHHSEWVDMNGDGRLDLLTARETQGSAIKHESKGQLMWMEQPADPYDFPWRTHVLAEGPGVWFSHKKLNDTTLAVFTPEYFGDKLAVYLVETGSQPAVAGSRIIDGTLGHGYASYLVDVNGDGELNLLGTTHNNVAEGDPPSQVYAYEVPWNDLLRGTFTKHVLATGFKVTEKGKHQACPGFPTPFLPEKGSAHAGEGPYIALAGDGTQSGFIMTPASHAGGQWEYETKEFVRFNGVVGFIAVAYLGTDNMATMFVPDYDEGRLNVYKWTS